MKAFTVHSPGSIGVTTLSCRGEAIAATVVKLTLSALNLHYSVEICSE